MGSDPDPDPDPVVIQNIGTVMKVLPALPGRRRAALNPVRSSRVVEAPWESLPYTDNDEFQRQFRVPAQKLN